MSNAFFHLPLDLVGGLSRIRFGPLVLTVLIGFNTNNPTCNGMCCQAEKVGARRVFAEKAGEI